MIAAHGGTLINGIVDGKERDALLARAAGLPTVELDAWGLSDVEMIAIGGFSPLQGFMTQADYQGVVTNRRLVDGLIWTIPVTLAVTRVQAAALKGDIALTTNGGVVAILHLEDAYAPDSDRRLSSTRNPKPTPNAAAAMRKNQSRVTPIV